LAIGKRHFAKKRANGLAQQASHAAILLPQLLPKRRVFKERLSLGGPLKKIRSGRNFSKPAELNPMSLFPSSVQKEENIQETEGKSVT
jgi:hypothetical protein